jgi:hypothetical protein
VKPARWAAVLLWVVPGLWSSNYLIARASHGVIAPHALAMGRWALALALMLPFVGVALWRQRSAVRQEWRHLLVLGALGMWVCGAFVYQAGHTTSATNIALLYAVAPVAITAVSLHLLHGLGDTEVPPQHVVDAARTWVDLEADITADVLPKVGHTLDPQLIERGLHQLRTFIPARLWREATLQALEMERADQAALAAAQGPLQRH